jgi:hypothetical protein
MNLGKLKSLFIDNGCQTVYVKKLAPNDNSKNQVYLGGSFELLNIFPNKGIVAESPGLWERERFKASINFAWFDDEGKLFPAPQSQLILYPKYPEVRFSGFLNKCEKAPSELMTQRLADRLLFLSVNSNYQIIGYVTSPESELANEFNKESSLSENGVFKVIELISKFNSRITLLRELKRIHELGWINSKRLDSLGNILPCDAPQCGGYTLEAELGIAPNGFSKPDFLGWEIKQFGVNNFKKLGSATITLMTPEPTGGFYASEGKQAFIKKYGYKDKTGKEDRMNFGGIHKVNKIHASTNLILNLIGFDESTGKIKAADGKIALLDSSGNEVASWSFSSMLEHWTRKHNQTCYIPSQSQKGEIKRYQYGSHVILGIGTDFQLFLKEMYAGNVYYDPGIKLEHISTKPEVKARSQFRVKSAHLPNLYKLNETTDVTLVV